MSGTPFDARLAATQGQLQKGDAAGARTAATALLAELPPGSTQRAAVLWVRARAAEALGEFSEGSDDLVAALAITPQETRMWDDLGILHMQAGRHADAAAAFAQSVARGPDNARAWNNLGNAFVAQGKLQEALRPFREAVTRKPDYALAWANLGNTLRDDGHEREGEHALQRALTLDPVQITALTALGSLRRQQGRIDEAVELYARAAKADSRNANVCLQLAFALADRDDLEGARRVYGEAERRDPRLLRAAIGARLTLPVIADDALAIARARTAFAAGIDELARIVPARIAGAPAERVLDGLRWSNFLLAYHGEDDLALQRRYAAFVGETLDRAAPALRAPLPRRPRAGMLRVGFVSSFFRDGTAGRYFERWITDLDRSRFEVAVYHLYPNTDHLTARLMAAADAFVHCPRWLPAQIAQRLRSDALDVIVYPELGMDATTFALAALRLAPLQCAGWGHPVTTGQPTIDVFLTSGAMEPEGAEAHYSERLVRLPGIGTRYAMPVAPPGATRADCGLPDDGPLLLCPQALFKIHPDDDALFARVLAAAPAARLVLFEGRHPATTAKYLARLDRTLAAAGVAREGRVLVLPPVTHERYLAINSVCDAMLDTTRWSGGNTSLDAIASALPLVTLPGRFMRARQSAGMFALMDIAELTAHDRDEYVRIAIRLAQDRGWRDAQAARIVAARGRIFDDPAPVAALSDLLFSLA